MLLSTKGMTGLPVLGACSNPEVTNDGRRGRAKRIDGRFDISTWGGVNKEDKWKGETALG